jgi:3-oxoacyl-[acyl-carrier protein] reductase
MDEKRIAFITGASRGIGKATAEKFLQEGWNVAGFYQKNQPEEAPGVKYFQMDAENPESIKTSFEMAFLEMGGVRALVNCAGILEDRHLEEYDAETIHKVIAVNEVGVYWATRCILGKMDTGAIVNISSTAAQVGSTDPIYAASKGAIASFTKSMALVLAPKIRVNCVAPGIANTDMGKKGWTQEEFEKRAEKIPMRRIASPTDIANGIYFLASDQAGYITGACLDINGGYVLR